MKEKLENRLYRRSITLLFAGIVFAILFLAILLGGGLLYLLVKIGIISFQNSEVSLSFTISMTILSSLVTGAVSSYVLGRWLMRPVNKIINGMNRLASGDFHARIAFSGILQKHPAILELTKSFNTMASELESTEMLRTDFVNNFSHEFKTPIVSISGFAKLLQHGNLSEKEKEEYLSIIEDESLRLSYMATNVLNMTKIENQSILSDLCTFNLSEQLRDCVLLLETKWSRKEIELEIELEEHMVFASKELLKQVWINLLDNAIKFTPVGGTVGVSICKTTDAVTVSIRNTGSEIPPEDRERIFRKFYQGDTSHAGEGNGVGLAIVKRVTELHKGKITVDSGDGWTSFTVSLPQTH